MKRVLFLLLSITYGLTFSTLSYADETVTVTATSSDISENLDLKTVATLFGQAKDLEQFEQMLNSPIAAACCSHRMKYVFLRKKLFLRFFPFFRLFILHKSAFFIL